MTFIVIGFALFVVVVLMKWIQIVPQKQVKIIERLGKYHRTAEAGLNTIIPFLDSIRDTIDLREQITKIEPQPVITRDNVTMEVDAVICFSIVSRISSGGTMFLSSMRITLTPHCWVAESRAARSCELVVSREASV